MRVVCEPRGECLQRLPAEAAQGLLDRAVWTDLVKPTDEEAAKVRSELGFSIPTRSAMADIEE